MNYPNNAVSEAKKNVSNAASNAASGVKSAAKSTASSIASDVEKTIDKTVDGKAGKSAEVVADSASSIAQTVFSSALSLLPLKNTDEVYSMLQTTVKDVQTGLTTARDSATSFVKKYPFYSLLGAAVFGASAVWLMNVKKSKEVRYDA